MKKLLSTAMALVLIIGLLTGCSVESQGEKTESVSNQYYLYYLNKDETKVTRQDIIRSRKVQNLCSRI